jgi:hypothetical protein
MSAAITYELDLVCPGVHSISWFLRGIYPKSGRRWALFEEGIFLKKPLNCHHLLIFFYLSLVICKHECVTGLLPSFDNKCNDSHLEIAVVARCMRVDIAIRYRTTRMLLLVFDFKTNMMIKLIRILFLSDALNLRQLHPCHGTIKRTT